MELKKYINLSMIIKRKKKKKRRKRNLKKKIYLRLKNIQSD
jgi:hypothetical protein